MSAQEDLKNYIYEAWKVLVNVNGGLNFSRYV